MFNVVCDSEPRRDLEWFRFSLLQLAVHIDIVSRNFNGFPLHLRFSDLLPNLIEVLLHKISILASGNSLSFLDCQRHVVKVFGGPLIALNLLIYVVN